MKNNRRMRPLLSFLLGALAAALALTPSAFAADELRNVALGDPVPGYELRTRQGESVLSKSFEGKVLVLVYLSAKQSNSARAAVSATQVIKELAEKGVELLFVTADFEHAESFDEQWKRDALSAPLAFDEDRTLYGKLGLIVFPTTLVVDRKGKLAHVILTRRTNYAHVLDAYVRHTLGELDAEGLAKQLSAGSLGRGSPRVLAQRHRAAARLLREKGLLSNAEKELKAAIALDPENVHVKLDLADLYAATERLKEGETLALDILKSDPKQRQAHLVLGIIYFKMKRLDKSENELLEALVHNPDPARTHYYLGCLYEAKGEVQKALEHYRVALKRLLDE